MKKPVKDMSLMQAESENIVLFYPHVSEKAKNQSWKPLIPVGSDKAQKLNYLKKILVKNLAPILLQLRLALELMRYIYPICWLV